MYKLRQRKAAATFRVLFYEETTGTNESFNICSLALKREAICTAQSSLFQGSLSFASARESLATRLMGSYNSFKARNSCKLKTDDSQFTFQEDYQKEGIDWSFQNFVDNRPCLDLIEGRTSVFSLINEVITRFLRSKSQSLTSLFESNRTCLDN